MGLLQNIRLGNAQPYDRTGDTSEAWPSQLNWSYNKYVGYAGLSKVYGVPRGNLAPTAWTLPMKIGGMAVSDGITGVAVVTPRITGSRRIIAALAGTSYIGVADKVSIIAIAKLVKQLVGLATVNADIAALVNLVPRAIAGTSEVDASLGGISSAVCAIIGEATLNADIAANALISSDIAGTSTFDSGITGSMYMVATILAEAILNGGIDAEAFMSSDIFVGAAVDPLSPSGLATAVWNAVADDFNNSGTMGGKVNLASSGGVDYNALADAVWSAAVRELTSNAAVDYDELADVVWNAPARELTEGTRDSAIDAITTIVQNIEKLTGNKVTKSGDVITIYEDDGVTVWRRYDLSGGGRTAR